MKENAIERWMAYLLTSGSDQYKYGTLTKGFLSHYSLGNDQYPGYIMTTTDEMFNQKIDPQYYDNQKCNCDKSCRNRKNRETDNEVNPTIFSQK